MNWILVLLYLEHVSAYLLSHYLKMNKIVEHRCGGEKPTLHSFFYKQLHFRPPEPQIFENRSNLASNRRAYNHKFLATFEPLIRNY